MATDSSQMEKAHRTWERGPPDQQHVLPGIVTASGFGWNRDRLPHTVYTYLGTGWPSRRYRLTDTLL